jgi:hypothetical protein
MSDNRYYVKFDETTSAYGGGTGVSPVQPSGDVRLSTSKLGSTVVPIPRSRH